MDFSTLDWYFFRTTNGSCCPLLFQIFVYILSWKHCFLSSQGGSSIFSEVEGCTCGFFFFLRIGSCLLSESIRLNAKSHSPHCVGVSGFFFHKRRNSECMRTCFQNVWIQYAVSAYPSGWYYIHTFHIGKFDYHVLLLNACLGFSANQRLQNISHRKKPSSR